MAYTIREVLNADGMQLPIFCGGASLLGIGISGTWVGTIKFYASADGVQFFQVGVTPFASGTDVQSTTATGNWFFNVRNYVAFKVVFTRTSGSAIVTMSAAQDSSWQDAFLAASTVNVSQSHAAGAENVVTQAAQANRAWRLLALSVGFSAAASAAVEVVVSDGGSTTLWDGYVPPSLNGISGGGTFNLPIPAVFREGGFITGGIVNTPGNSMVITVSDPGGSVVSKVNACFAAA